MVDNKLNWKLQIKSICSKLSSVCGVISKVRHYLDRKALMLICNSLFDSRLRYAVLGWGTASNQEISNSGSYRTELSDLLISLLFEPLWPRSILILRYSPLIKFSFFKKTSSCTTYTTKIYHLRLVHTVTNQRIGIRLGMLCQVTMSYLVPKQIAANVQSNTLDLRHGSTCQNQSRKSPTVNPFQKNSKNTYYLSPMLRCPLYLSAIM